jgi:hypothetical protein
MFRDTRFCFVVMVISVCVVLYCLLVMECYVCVINCKLCFRSYNIFRARLKGFQVMRTHGICSD